MMGIRRDRRGAVIVEFALAFLPIAAMFTVLMEVARLSVARIGMEHAASVSARACAVIQKPRPETPNGEGLDGDEKDINRAGQQALRPWTGWVPVGPLQEHVLSDVTIECPAQSDPSGTDVATVTATYHCTVPLGGQLLCGSLAFTGVNTTNNSFVSDPSTVLEVKARMAHQGAKWKVEE